MTTTASRPHVCPAFFAFFLDNRIRRWLQSPARIVGAYVQPGDTVLDIGCGPGFFTFEMARRVGPAGRVYAIDLQAAMLAKVECKAARKGLTERIRLHQCRADQIGLAVQADFALAYYTVHETPSVDGFLEELHRMVRPGGCLLVVEPKIHVSRTAFDAMCRAGERLGWEIVDTPTGKGGRSIVYRRA